MQCKKIPNQWRKHRRIAQYYYSKKVKHVNRGDRDAILGKCTNESKPSEWATWQTHIDMEFCRYLDLPQQMSDVKSRVNINDCSKAKKGKTRKTNRKMPINRERLFSSRLQLVIYPIPWMEAGRPSTHAKYFDKNSQIMQKLPPFESWSIVMLYLTKRDDDK